MGETSIQIQNVKRGAHVEWMTNTGGKSGEEGDRIEVYTGNVIVNDQGTGKILGLNWFNYLPLSAAVIRTYGDPATGPAPAFNATILVTPIGIHGQNEEWLASVDDWHLEFLPQKFSVAPRQKFYCPVLNYSLNLMNSVILRIGYQVTLVTSRDVQVGELPLDPTDAPTAAV